MIRIEYVPYALVSFRNIDPLRSEQTGDHYVDDTYRMHFIEWKLANFDQNVIKICSYQSNWHCVTITSFDGLVLNMWQVMTKSNIE